ncbi:MAG: methionine-rich copper-binding protein CopC [Ascidiaceihabitans sp.]|jgi:methionine-rich copper-binding protein CopC
MKHLLIILLLLPSLAFSHSKVSATVPVNGAILDIAPDDFTFNFDKTIRLVSVVVNGESATLPDQDAFAKTIIMTAPALDKGRHTVEWRGLSSDGHPVSGTFTFTVQ